MTAILATVAILFLYGCAEPVPIIETGEYWQRNPHPMEDPNVEYLPKDDDCNCGTSSLDPDCVYAYESPVSVCGPEDGDEDDLAIGHGGEWHTETPLRHGILECGFQGIAYQHDNGRTIHATDLEAVLTYGTGDTIDHVHVWLGKRNLGNGLCSWSDDCWIGGTTYSCLTEVSLDSNYRLAIAEITTYHPASIWAFRVCYNP